MITPTGTGLTFSSVTASAAPRPAASLAISRSSGHGAVEDFLRYMKESPAERMADSWLAAHGLSEAQLAAMAPDKRAATLRQMAKELEQQVADAARKSADKKRATL